MSWLRDFIVGLKDAYVAELKVIILLIIAFILIVGFVELYKLII